MKKIIAVSILCCLFQFNSFSQTFQSIERIDAVTGKSTDLKSLISGKAMVLIFHSLGCPYSKMYEKRLIALRNSYSNNGIRFVLINPESEIDPESQKVLKSYIDDSGLNMNYLIDEEQVLVKQLNITKIPEALIILNTESGLNVVYRGAIDNNPQAESAVSERILERAINQVLRNEEPSPATVRATGCNMKSF